MTMTKRHVALLAIAGALALTPPAQARSYRHHVHHRAIDANGNFAGDPRPSRWCAWWLRRELGIARSAFRNGEYNLARAFAYIGSRAAGPAVGAIVVFPHHVGIITRQTSTGWVLKSGNDNHAVRERERSLRGAIAFRWPNTRTAYR